MKILITGAKGQLGSQLIDIIKKGRSELGDISEVVKEAEVIGASSQELDISDIEKVRKFIASIRPDVVINAAAYTNVDGCEADEETAFRVNALGPRNLAIVCEEISAKLVHISTDYVFSGEGNKPFKEYDEPCPQSIYGKTKNKGDYFVKEFCSRHFIVRASWIYGYKGKNFVYTIIKAAKERGSLKVVYDQIGNPTNSEDLVHHILKLISTEEYGVYHCAGHGECSWYDFACEIVEFAQIPCLVEPCSTDEYPSKTQRPQYSALDNMMLRCTVGDEMRHWKEALKVFIDNIV
jgi:dTDP-4-dehydrorhamnose reductase